jgi:hypothetical protein
MLSFKEYLIKLLTESIREEFEVCCCCFASQFFSHTQTGCVFIIIERQGTKMFSVPDYIPDWAFFQIYLYRLVIDSSKLISSFRPGRSFVRPDLKSILSYVQTRKRG